MNYKLPSLLALLLSFPLHASAQIKVGPWQMHEGTEGLIPFITQTDEQKRAALDKAALPGKDDKGWGKAPVNAKGSVDFDRVSNIEMYMGFKQLDFLYFQTTVDIPKGTKIDTFQVEFDSVDDGARVFLFNSKHPKGFYEAKNDIITSSQQAKADFSGEAVAGEVNRIVVAQYDLCDPGNTINGINVIVNGKTIPVAPARPIVPGSHGDVHINTPDGLVYDFQGTGEFLACQSDDGSVVVQARQDLWEKKPSASINTAVAIVLDGTKFEYYVKPKSQLFINGEAQTIPANSGSGITVGKDGGTGPNYTWTVYPGKTDYTIYRADGSFGVRVIVAGDSHIDYGVARLAGTAAYSGMLGNLDRDPQNDMTLRDGGRVNPPANTKDLNTFTDSWRLKAGESLFGDVKRANALAAASTPHTAAEIDPAKLAAAEKTVRAAGITDPLAVHQATYDVAQTGNKAFIESAKTVEAARKALPPEEQKITAGDAATTAVLAGGNDAPGAPGLLEKVTASLDTWEGNWSWPSDDSQPANHSKLIKKSETEFTYVYAGQKFELKGVIGHSGGDRKAPLCVNLDLPNGDHLRFEWKSQDDVIAHFWLKGKKAGIDKNNPPQATSQMKRAAAN